MTFNTKIILIAFMFISCNTTQLLLNKENSSDRLTFEGQIKKITCNNYRLLKLLDYDFFYTEYLIISGDKKYIVGNDIFKFANLKELEIFGNASFEDCTDKVFNNLERVSLIDQKFNKKLPLWIYNCSNITSLCFDANQQGFDFESLLQFDKLSSLYINLYNIQSKEINKNIFNLINLNTLSISTDKEMDFPDEITNLKNLEWMNMNVDISGNIDKLSELHNLSILEVNSFKNFDQEYPNLKKLVKLKRLYFKKHLTDDQYYKLRKLMPNLDYTISVPHNR